MNKLRFGWFSSASGSDQAALALFNNTMDYITSGYIPAEISFVFCDRTIGELPAANAFLKGVEERGIGLITLSSKKLRQALREEGIDQERARQDFDEEIISLIKSFSVDVVVMVGYMLIVSPLLSNSFYCINLHPALPGGPKGTWREVIWQLMSEGVRETGAMMHLVIPELDAGPPLTYFRLSLSGPDFDPLWEEFEKKIKNQRIEGIRKREGDSEPLFQLIRREGLHREFPLIILTLKRLAESRLVITSRGVQVGNLLISGGLDLTSQVERFLRKSTIP